MPYEKGPFRLGRECYASLLLQKPKPCPIRCITSSKGDLSPAPLGRNLHRNSTSYQPSQAINKAFTVTCYLLEPIVHTLIFPPLLISQCKQRSNLQKNDTRQPVSCWHHSDLGIVLLLWNAEQARRLRVQSWKEVGEEKAGQDAPH